MSAQADGAVQARRARDSFALPLLSLPILLCLQVLGVSTVLGPVLLILPRRHAADLNRRGVGDDVDAPTREFGGQAGVLPLFANGQGQLIIRDNHPCRARSLIGDGD